MLKLIASLLITDADRAFATAKAINRGCSVYMFRVNYI